MFQFIVKAGWMAILFKNTYTGCRWWLCCSPLGLSWLESSWALTPGSPHGPWASAASHSQRQSSADAAPAVSGNANVAPKEKERKRYETRPHEWRHQPSLEPAISRRGWNWAKSFYCMHPLCCVKTLGSEDIISLPGWELLQLKS